MGVDFVRSRESHLTIAHDAVYRSIFKVIESESLAVGDRVIVEFTNGMYDQCIVVTTDPLSLAQYKPKRYIREDVLYRGTFIPEHLRKGVVSDNAATGDGTGDGESSGGSEGGVYEDSSGSGDGSYNECSCPSGCSHCKDCGKSMIGHWGYEHLYCHCWDDPEQDATGDGEGGGGSGDSGDDHDTHKPCHCPHHCRFCVCPKRPDSTTGLPDELNPVMLECPDEVLEGETVSCKVKLLKVSDHDVDVKISISPSLASIPDTVIVPAGKLESSFEFAMGDKDLEIYAGVLCEFTTNVKSRSLLPEIESLAVLSGDTAGQPFRIEIRLNKTAKEITVIEITSGGNMVAPENLVIMPGEQNKTFVVVPFESCTLTARYGSSEKSCQLPTA